MPDRTHYQWTPPREDDTDWIMLPLDALIELSNTPLESLDGQTLQEYFNEEEEED